MKLLQKITLSSYQGKKQPKLKGPTKLAGKHFCRHDWRDSKFQIPAWSGNLRRQQCEKCGMVEMR